MCILYLDLVIFFIYYYKSFIEFIVFVELFVRMLFWFFFIVEGFECNKGKGVILLFALLSIYMKSDMNIKN